MKLALISPGFDVKAQQRAVYLSQNGFQVWQFSSRSQYEMAQIPTPSLPPTAYQFRPIPVYRPGNPHKGFIRSTLKEIKEILPDIIAVERDPDTLIAYQAVWLRRLWAPQAKLVFHSWQNVPRPLKFHVKFVLHATLKAADCICCANKEGFQILRQWGYDGSLVLQPWMGVDTNIFYHRNAESQTLFPPSAFVVGYVGRLVPEKGLTDLLQAVAQLPTAVHCAIIGQGFFLPKLQTLAQTLNITERVHFLGVVPHDQLPFYYSLMNVMVLPSRTTPTWKEQFGRVLIEAMACHTPVIGSSSGAIPEVIQDAGLVFPEGDVPALAQAIRSLLNDSAYCRKLGQRGRKLAKDVYDQSQISRQISQVYKSVVNGRNDNTFLP